MGEYSFAIVFGILIILLFIFLFKKPLGWLLKLLLNSVFGLILLLAANYIGGFFGVHIGINRFTILISGILGIPSVAFLLILQFLL